jgi:hypothetical protein
MTDAEYNRRWCDERHGGINDRLEKGEIYMDRLDRKLNWFYLITISTLVLALANLWVSTLG